MAKPDAKLLAVSAALICLGDDLAGAPLAGNAPSANVPAPGKTIAEAAKAATPGGGPGNWAHGFGHNAHVKTPGGEKLFHEPIGALIIKHGPHLWVNQHGGASEEAEHGGAAEKAAQAAEHGTAHVPEGHVTAQQAVDNGTHKYVQAQGHTWAVHKDATVHVPADTDLHDEAKVAAAPKVVTGTHHGTHSFANLGDAKWAGKVHDAAGIESHMGADWKALPPQPAKKPVSVKGSHAGWIPAHWSVYKNPAKPDDQLAGKFAHDPDTGDWYLIGSSAPQKLSAKQAASAKQFVADGKLAKESGPVPAHEAKAAAEAHAAAQAPKHPDLGAVPHLHADEPAEPAKVNIAGVHVTHEQVKSAIAHLEAAKSTNVKGPLKSKGHPLADMDYMSLSKQVLKDHPELKVPKGTKKQHVGQVKLAVLHHLHEQAAALAKNDAETHVAAEGKKAAASAAGHAHKLTPAVAEFPQENLEAKAEKAAGAAAKDTAQAAETAGPGSAAESYLESVAPSKTAADEEPETKPEPEPALGEAPPAAPVGVVKSPHEPASWGGVSVTTGQLKEAADWLEATATGHGSFKQAMKKLANPMADAAYMDVAKAWKKAHPEQAKGLNTKQLMLAHVNDLLASMDKADAETGHAQASALDSAIADGVPKPGWEDTLDGANAYALWKADETGVTHYAFLDSDGKYTVLNHPPAGAADSGLSYFTASPGHTLEHHVGGGGVFPVHDAAVSKIVAAHLSHEGDEPGPYGPAPDEPGTEPTAPEPHEPVLEGKTEVDHGTVTYPPYAQYDEIHQALVHATPQQVSGLADKTSLKESIGKALWSSSQVHDKDQYVLSKGIDDSGWHWELSSAPPAPGSYAASAPMHYKVTPGHVVVQVMPDGEEHPWTGENVLAAVHQVFGEPEPEPEPEGPAVPVWVNGQKTEAPDGSTVYTGSKVTDPATSNKYVKYPDGTWHEYYQPFNQPGIAHNVPGPGQDAEYDDMVSAGDLTEVTGPSAEGKTLYLFAGKGHWADPGTTAWTDHAHPAAGLYLRSADGQWSWWAAGTPGPGDAGAYDAKTLQQSVMTGDLVPHGPHAEKYAKALGAGTKTGPEPGPEPLTAPDTPPVAPDKTVTVAGTDVGTVPADATVYWYSGDGTSELDAPIKYVKYAEGSWGFINADKGIAPAYLSGTYDAQLAAGTLTESGKLPAAAAKPPGPGEEGPVHVSVQGVTAAAFPEGTKVYYFPSDTGGENPATVSVKYAKLPDGTWKAVTATGAYDDISGSFDSFIGNGFAEDTPGAPAEAGAAGPVYMVHVQPYQAPKLIEFPPGTQLYTKTSSSGHVTAYGKEPSGTWLTGGSYGVQPANAYEKLDDQLAAGKLTPADPATSAEVQQVKDTQELLGKLKTSAAPGGKQATWQQALAGALAGKHHGSVTVVAKDGKYVKDYAGPDTEYWTADATTLAGTHYFADGSEEEIPFADIKQALDNYLVPDSVYVAGSVHGYGHYYKPKGKAHLEIKAPGYKSDTYKYGAAAKASYIWHDTKGGTKEVTPVYAAKWLEDGTAVHHDQAQAPSATAPSLKKVSYASTVKAGTYQVWNPHSGTVDETQSVTIHPDGSKSYTSGGNAVALADDAAGTAAWESLLGKGSGTAAVLDQHGTSVVTPGVQPGYYVIFGTSLDKDDVENFLDQVTEADDAGPYGWTKAFGKFIPFEADDTAKAYMQSFLKDNGAVNGIAQRAVVTGLLRELLQVPQQPAGTQLAEGGGFATFLKSLPPGISSAHDVFTWNDHGYPVPYSGDVAGDADYLSSPQLTDRIKAISAEFGGGKVVGTHVSSLTKDQKALWLKSWQSGKMTTVFALDASGGKVSPAHPGAPANTATHTITWSPWDPSQVPAGKEIEGTWTPLGSGVTPVLAEVNNYLLKAGLQHGEYLTPAERREFYTAHRNGKQAAADIYSRYARQRFTDGSAPHSGPLTWTSDLKPAKSYDHYLEDGKPATSWNSTAVKDYIADHSAEVAPYIEQVADEHGYTAETLLPYYKGSAVQKYLDHVAAEKLAEELRPKYEPVPGEPGIVADQYGKRYLWHEGPEHDLNRLEAAAALARTWGFQAGNLTRAHLETAGTPGLITPELTPDGTLAHVPGGITALTDRQLADIAKGHVLDHALNNPASTPGSYLLLPDGSVAGLGLAGAFTGDGWDGTDLHGMNAHAVQPVAALLNAVTSGTLGKDRADKAYAAAVRAARRMAKVSSGTLGSALDKAGLTGPERDAATARVTGLAGAVQGLWDSAYAQAGWTPPDIPAAALPSGLHSGFSEPEFFPHVMAAKSHGAAAFFAGPHLEDGHILVWTEKAGDNRYLRGETSVRGDALDAMVKWASSHVTASPKAESKPASTDVPGTSGYYATIINAAKAVSMHAADQKWDGAWTSQQLTALQALKADLTTKLTAVEFMADHPEGGYNGTHGPLPLAIDAYQHYLAQIQKVEDAKATGGAFKPGDIPDWTKPPYEPPEPEAKTAPGLTVELRKATRVLSASHAHSVYSTSGESLSPEGELELGDQIYEYPGQAWHITLPTGEVIEVNDQSETSTPAGQHGRVRFRAVASDGAASLERIREQLQAMGVPLEEAQPHDMELFYWRHLAGVLNERKDATAGKHASVWQALKHAQPGSKGGTGSYEDRARLLDDFIAAGRDPGDELALWRQAWGNLTSPEQVQQWTDSQGYLPHFSHLDITAPEVPSGKPYWYRFDATPGFLAGQQPVSHGMTDLDHAPLVVYSGGLASTEARLRSLGLWVAGMSSQTDMVSHGSAGVVYTRLNQTGGKNLWLLPSVLARTSTYGFNSDHYGDISLRKTNSPFSLEKAAAFSGDSNETNIKDFVSFLDDTLAIQVPADERAAILQRLADNGITHIRGVPAADRILSGTVSKTALDALMAKENPAGWLAHPLSEWTPPDYTPAAGEQSVTESAAEHAASEAATTPATALTGAAYSTDHAAGVPQKTMNQVFYGQDTKLAVSDSLASATKHELAATLSAAMASTDDELGALAADAGLSAPAGWGDTERDRAVAALIATWAQGNSAPVMLAIQDRAHALFGISKEPLSAIGIGDTTSASVSAAADLTAKHAAVLDDYLTAQWNATQAALGAAGADHLTLYRVMKFSSGSLPDWVQHGSTGDTIGTPAARPLSPWGYTQAAAEGAGIFGGGDVSVTVKATVPKEAVLSTPKTGMGCLNETECIVLDMPGQWEIIAMSGKG